MGVSSPIKLQIIHSPLYKDKKNEDEVLDKLLFRKKGTQFRSIQSMKLFY